MAIHLIISAANPLEIKNIAVSALHIGREKHDKRTNDPMQGRAVYVFYGEDVTVIKWVRFVVHYSLTYFLMR